jgi:hypothetical protein
MDKINFIRQELYDLVWTSPILTLSKKYNISDAGLRKICIKMNIPLPKSGHWQKLRFNKKIVKIPLPDNYQGDNKITLSLRGETEHKGIPYRSEIFDVQKEIEENLGLKLTVPERLSNPDKLIIAAKNSLSSRKPDEYLYIGTISSWRDELDIRVSRDNISRTLRFLDTLIKGLRLRGHDVQIKNGGTYAIVEEGDFKILIREKMKKVVKKDGSWDRTVYHPTGILSFQSNYREWKDGKLSLEQQLSKIIANLEIAGKEWKERRVQRKREEEERKEKERLQREFLMLQEKDLAEFKETLLKASRWHKANNLREYIHAIEQKAIANNNFSEELKKWLDWAKKKRIGMIHL